MPGFHEFTMRHGEAGVQALVERLERYEGIVISASLTLEERWNAVMFDVATEQRLAA